MGLTGEGKGSEGWGMGFFLVFFPEESQILDKKKPNFISSVNNTLFKRSNSSQLLSKTQSTISICALLLFTSLLLFTLSTFEPTTTHNSSFSRRHLSSKNTPVFSQSHALQGMGTLYRKGTSSKTDLIISHVPPSTTPQEFRIFLRLFHHSPLSSRSDLLLLFPNSISSNFHHIILQENLSFLQLPPLTTTTKSKYKPDPIWGKGTGYHNNQTNSTLNHGSIITFTADELDPENSLSGFLDKIPITLRRWACYPMLLGRVRRNFKHIMLINLQEVLLFTDPLSKIRNKPPETVYLSTTQTKHRKHDKTNINPGIIMGGGRGIRRLSNAMLIEIVRATMQHKKKTPVSDSAILTQLAKSEFVGKSVNLIISDSIPEASSLKSLANHSVVMRGNGNSDLNDVIMKYLCSGSLYSSVYSDC